MAKNNIFETNQYKKITRKSYLSKYFDLINKNMHLEFRAYEVEEYDEENKYISIFKEQALKGLDITFSFDIKSKEEIIFLDLFQYNKPLERLETVFKKISYEVRGQKYYAKVPIINNTNLALEEFKKISCEIKKEYGPRQIEKIKTYISNTSELETRAPKQTSISEISFLLN